MKDGEYTVVQNQLTLLAGLVNDMNLDGFLRRIETAQAAGPLIDPTLYREASDNLEKIETIARGAKQFQQAVRQAAKLR